MCGEKILKRRLLDGRTGSPPRVRGKVMFSAQGTGDGGITPACAGKRGDRSDEWLYGEDHPRVCGEKQRRLSAR